MTVEEILTRFNGVEGGNGKWTCRCPAHEDNRNSLSVGVREDDGAILLNCHANCEKSAILQAAGLQFRDLFPQANGSNGHHAAMGPFAGVGTVDNFAVLMEDSDGTYSWMGDFGCFGGQFAIAAADSSYACTTIVETNRVRVITCVPLLIEITGDCLEGGTITLVVTE